MTSPDQSLLAGLVSDERLKRGAKVLCAAMGDDWKRQGPRGLLSAYGPLVRAVLEADAPALMQARIAGMEELSAYFSGLANEANELASYHHLSEGGNFDKGWVALEEGKRLQAIADAIDARIAALRADEKTG